MKVFMFVLPDTQSTTEGGETMQARASLAWDIFGGPLIAVNKRWLSVLIRED